jgi:hypothetical protein
MAQALTTAFARFEAQVAEHPVLDETQVQWGLDTVMFDSHSPLPRLRRP